MKAFPSGGLEGGRGSRGAADIKTEGGGDDKHVERTATTVDRK